MTNNSPVSQARCCNDSSLTSPRGPSESSLHPLGGDYRRFRAEDQISEMIARVVVVVVLLAVCMDWEPVLAWVWP
jgi:hypothetical protein